MITDLSIRSFVLRMIAVLLSLSIHELAHGLVSYRLGDPTAKLEGRLTLNPFHHIDIFGFVCLLVFGFGWAKPVPVDARYYRNKKTGLIWTAFAGPMSNFVLGFVCVFIYYALMKFVPSGLNTGIGLFLLQVLAVTARLSIGFGIFNMIPVPPLDGSKVLFAFLPDETYYRFIQGSTVYIAILFAALYIGILNAPLQFLQTHILEVFVQFSSWIF